MHSAIATWQTSVAEKEKQKQTKERSHKSKTVQQLTVQTKSSNLSSASLKWIFLHLAVYDLTFTEHKPSLKSTVEILKWKDFANRVTYLIKYPEGKKT